MCVYISIRIFGYGASAAWPSPASPWPPLGVPAKVEKTDGWPFYVEPCWRPIEPAKIEKSDLAAHRPFEKHGPVDKSALGGLEKHGPVDKSPWPARSSPSKSMALSTNPPWEASKSMALSTNRSGWLDRGLRKAWPCREIRPVRPRKAWPCRQNDLASSIDLLLVLPACCFFFFVFPLSLPPSLPSLPASLPPRGLAMSFARRLCLIDAPRCSSRRFLWSLFVR